MERSVRGHAQWPDLVFKAGEQTKEITINVVADKLTELDETCVLTLSGANANTTIRGRGIRIRVGMSE